MSEELRTYYKEMRKERGRLFSLATFSAWQVEYAHGVRIRPTVGGKLFVYEFKPYVPQTMWHGTALYTVRAPIGVEISLVAQSDNLFADFWRSGPHSVPTYEIPSGAIGVDWVELVELVPYKEE